MKFNKISKLIQATVFLSVFLFCDGCHTHSYKVKPFAIHPDHIVKITDLFIKNGRHDKAFSKRAPAQIGKVVRSDLVVTKISYPPNHKYAKIRYSFKKPRRIKNTSGSINEYSFLEIKVDSKGECKLHGIAHSQCKQGQPEQKFLNKEMPYLLSEIIQKANRYIESDLKIRKKSIRPNRMANKYVRECIKQRLPDKITAKNLILLGVEYSSSNKIITVKYCIKESLSPFGRNQVYFSKLEINITESGKCSGSVSSYGTAYIDLDIEESNFLNNSTASISSSEIDDIKETVLRDMFKNSGYGGKIKMRFLQDDYNDAFYKRFSDLKVPVRSALKKYDDYTNGYARRKTSDPSIYVEKYYPCSKDSLFYRIEDITVFDENCVFVDASVTFGMLAAGGRLYTLLKKNGKWQVVKSRCTWVS